MDTNAYRKGLRSMDEMKIESKFITGIVSKIAKKVVRDKLGYNIDIQLNGLRTTVIDDKTHVHLDVDLELTKEELNKLLKSIGV
jgi:hypothetical protein